MRFREPRGASKVDQATLAPLRAMRGEDALALIAIHFKADSTYRPVKDAASRRWHARTARGEFEIVTTGTKWYETRANATACCESQAPTQAGPIACARSATACAASCFTSG